MPVTRRSQRGGIAAIALGECARRPVDCCRGFCTALPSRLISARPGAQRFMLGANSEIAILERGRSAPARRRLNQDPERLGDLEYVSVAVQQADPDEVNPRRQPPPV